jgi:membrane fusion protein, heavy metal efflux system
MRTRTTLRRRQTMATRIELRSCAALFALLLSITGVGCGGASEAETEAAETNWSVTAWGNRYEVFPEAEPLVAGETAIAHTHVTRLSDFAPLSEGAVEIVLSGAAGSHVFRAEQPVRPGIYQVEIKPPSQGEYDLTFRIHAEGEAEEIRGGRVRVGTAEAPGSVVRAPAPRGAVGGGAPVSFLKEQQWQSQFATDWVRSGEVSQSVSGLATVRAPAGGDAAITAPVDGVLQPAGGTWPFPGMTVGRGSALFQLAPTVSADVSLPSLQSSVSELDTALGAARARLARLEELFALDAVSRREIDEARTRVQTLESRARAARQDLSAARASRTGGTGGGVAIRAPFAGQIASISATPGTTIAAGTELARLVRMDALWLEIALPPTGARSAAAGIEGVVLSDRERPPTRISEGVRLISVAPEISPDTGTVNVLLAIPPDPSIPLGSTFEAHVLTGLKTSGIAIPSTAVVDDGGVAVVYLQLAGESFVRQQITVLSQEGDRMLVEGLVAGQRLVTRGGDAIRRASLMSSGAAQGHVH